MSASFLSNLNTGLLLRLAGERSYKRGEAYFDEERVCALVRFAGMLAATVEGTEDYRVKLWAEGNSLGYSCDCPFADEGNFCKHCVAVGLAWIAEGQGRRDERDSAGVLNLNDARAFLERQDKESLVEMILRAALDNEQLCESLLLEAGIEKPERGD
jgi:uncharacterized Zn finger protein